jgi:hypothetical protein
MERIPQLGHVRWGSQRQPSRFGATSRPGSGVEARMDSTPQKENRKGGRWRSSGVLKCKK